MPSDEFEKYLNQLSEKDKAGVDQAIEGLKKNTPTRVEETTDIGAPSSIPNKNPDPEKALKTSENADVTVDNTLTTPVSEKAGEQAVEAAAPVKDQVTVGQTEQPAPELGTPATPEQPKPDQQSGRDNAFTQLQEAKPKEQAPPAPEQDKER